MARILVVYGTTYGHTAAVARRMRDALALRGHDVVLATAAELTHATSLERFDGVIVGSSVIAGRHHESVERFVRAHRIALDVEPSAFFSVSASAADPGAKSQAEARRMLHDFLGRVEWLPRLTATIAGAVSYTRYRRPLRWYMQYVSWRHGGSTDASRDHVYTDWDAVERFALAFAGSLDPSPAARTRTGIDFDAGVLLPSATASIGTSTFASGK